MRKYALVPAIWALTCASSAFAQFGGDWMTTGNDAQRSNWVRNDGKISLERMRQPGFDLVWKMKMEPKPGQRVAVTPPALLDFYIGYRGFRTLGFFGTGSDRVVGVDTDLGRLEWEKTWSTKSRAGGPGCPGGMTSAVTRPTNTAFPAPFTPRGFGRSTPAKSGVGEPMEGAVTLQAQPVRRTPPPPAAKPKPGAPAPVNPFAPHIEYVMAVSGDGKLHSMWVSNGNETDAPVPFLPPNANASGLIVFDKTAYVTTTNRCGGVDNGVWALDLDTKQVNHWKTTAKAMAGTAGPVAGPDGTIYAAAGSELVALSPKKLETLAMYKTGGPEFTSSPVLFEFKGKNLLAATTNDGRLQLLDTAAMGKALDGSEAFSGKNFQAGALASWQDAAGNRWILAPATAGGSASGFQANGDVKSGAIAAFKVVEKDGAPKLEAGWMSRDLVSPMPPIVVNGVVFALSAGAPRTSNAVLYALDSSTGKELWSSGASMTAHSMSGMSAGGTRVYVATQDGMQYAFGFPIEH